MIKNVVVTSNNGNVFKSIVIGARGPQGATGATGPQGPPGPSGAAASAYIHTQLSSSAEWIVNHNLGLNPIISCISTGGIEVEGNPIHVNLNQTRIYFSSPQSGEARCI